MYDGLMVCSYWILFKIHTQVFLIILCVWWELLMHGKHFLQDEKEYRVSSMGKWSFAFWEILINSCKSKTIYSYHNINRNLVIIINVVICFACVFKCTCEYSVRIRIVRYLLLISIIKVPYAIKIYFMIRTFK